MNNNVMQFPNQQMDTNTSTTTKETSPKPLYGSGQWGQQRRESLDDNWKRYQMQSMMGLDYVPCMEFTLQYYDIVEYYTRGPGR
jgi:hypothetical protein